MSKKSDSQKVPDSVPRVHEAGGGISEETARQLDLALHQMEQGGLVEGEVVHDPSSETYENIFPADIGTSSHALHKGSSSEQVAFGAMVEREKNADPDIEHSEAYDRAVEKFDATQEEDEEEDE